MDCKYKQWNSFKRLKNNLTSPLQANKMKAKAKAAFQAYILECIQLEEYGITTNTPAEKLQAFFNQFNEEFSFEDNKRRYPLTEVRLMEWLQGLPSCFNVVFYYDEIEAKAKELGITNKNIDQNWFKYLAHELMNMFKNHNINTNR